MSIKKELMVGIECGRLDNLIADARRLDWMEAHEWEQQADGTMRWSVGEFGGSDVRAAIDANRKAFNEGKVK
jgi:hypothetical protein